ncbi:DUF3488 and transglutaminase-like domain-containing protein [Ferrimonas gelatinilytica]|uniref:DUF3488 and transglutaminase-like domain-containing protein n=1 Tax=Ferrimonas gelatinilytica TaxID=1255257 RepID=A0ABP9RU97_9GAMM
MTLNRPAQGWLLVSQLGVVLPLAHHTPPWTLGIFALCLLWRVGIYLGRVARPPRALINLLGLGAILTLVGVMESLGTMSALINLLLLAYALKAIESTTRADLTVVVITGYFLIGMQLIHQFNPAIALQLILLTVLNTTPLLAQYRPDTPLRVVRQAMVMILMSLPLALLLFMVVPRLSPIWQIQSPALARTGLSDSLALGDLAQLSRSDRLVFRARFDGPPPPPEARYWRALVLEHYDGTRWQANTPPPRTGSRPDLEHWPSGGPDTPWQAYQLLVEPNPNPWLPSLKGSISEDPQVIALEDQLLNWRVPRHSRTAIALLWPSTSAQAPPLTEAARQRLLQLPAEGEPRARAWAEKLRDQYPDANARLNAIMAPFSQAPFRYTLKPPALGPDPIDGFLFDHQAGFCAHYASAMVFVARAAGIPARMVSGYQGGELSPSGQLLSVYQFNAHAWTEVYLEQTGWQRIDPTAAVAPARIEQGPEAALGEEAHLLSEDAWLSGRGSAWSVQIRGWLAQLDYQWSQWVMGFDEHRQLALWQRWLGGLSLLKGVGVILAALVLLALGQLALTLWRQRPPRVETPVRLYRQTLKRLERLGAGILPGEGPLTHLARLRRGHPELAAALAPLCQAFVSLRYETDSTDDKGDVEQQLKAFRHHRRRFHRALRRRKPAPAGPE